MRGLARNASLHAQSCAFVIQAMVEAASLMNQAVKIIDGIVWHAHSIALGATEEAVRLEGLAGRFDPVVSEMKALARRIDEISLGLLDGITHLQEDAASAAHAAKQAADIVHQVGHSVDAITADLRACSPVRAETVDELNDRMQRLAASIAGMSQVVATISRAMERVGHEIIAVLALVERLAHKAKALDQDGDPNAPRPGRSGKVD